MIRRDVHLGEGASAWMLISQLEHARVSAELARHAIARFPARNNRASSETLAIERIRREVLAAIQYHDDGWAQWEISVPIDRERGVTPSFTELTPAAAISIWSKSIETAEDIGLLAAWMVAGHFLRLARNSDDAKRDDRVLAWRAQIEGQRASWFKDWQDIAPARHTLAIAEEALQWLWTFDEISLWLCCTCSPGEASIPCAPHSYCAGRGTPVELKLRVAGNGEAVGDPWYFDALKIAVSITGNLVPVAHYRSSTALLKASTSHQLEWTLAPATQAG